MTSRERQTRWRSLHLQAKLGLQDEARDSRVGHETRVQDALRVGNLTGRLREKHDGCCIIYDSDLMHNKDKSHK